ncbi:helix-turn-helix domain-containing protein [Streptomyces polyrhachis]|uniref:Helix-turn-helix domain-containing protein n=1 Tax=Streptomyces polyrhachis TaxID=1282885 RepID=A0ABW2GB37_9ACTN
MSAKLQGDLAWICYDRRKELGYTQARAAARCGITQAKVSIIEGSGAQPTPALLEKVSHGLEATVTVVYHRQHDPGQDRHGELPAGRVLLDQYVPTRRPRGRCAPCPGR